MAFIGYHADYSLETRPFYKPNN